MFHFLYIYICFWGCCFVLFGGGGGTDDDCLYVCAGVHVYLINSGPK